MVRGDVQNIESVACKKVVADAIQLENSKKQFRFITKYYDQNIYQIFSRINQQSNIKTVLDVGTAMGDVISTVAAQNPRVNFFAIDIMDEAIEIAQRNYCGITNVKFKKANFLGDSVMSCADVVVCLQTLEHIEDHTLIPFIEKLFKTARCAVVVSVPREPYWCFANLLRLKYWSRLGNTPHHVQHWRMQSFEKVCRNIASQVWTSKYEVVKKSPLHLWTILVFMKEDVCHAK